MDTGSGTATAAAVCFELRETGKRLAQARADESAELDRLAALLRMAEGAGLDVHEIAGRAGVGNAARPAERAAREPRPDVDARIACALGVGEAESEQALIGAVAHGPVGADEVPAALRRLVASGDVRIVPAGSSAKGAVPQYRLTARGAARLPARLRQATMPRAREWIVRVATTPAEAAAIDRATQRLLGTQEVSVIPAGARAGMRAPELAWRVEASYPEIAIDAAVARTRVLRGEIDGLQADEPVAVVALVHPCGGAP
jgi:uncharacterized protein (DUF736 family)